ncbi:CPBP family intramembrane glutamic endopeptidase [Paenibacillus sp. S150]|uniref:CPBP family intramembrane glutamic endopeptidase n=1 Tax=Paenibacillus sp. S150 TaxID=2749826 RepID=UPI001C587CD4|nr:CPBP family intramembrane glutamic endopeptidase [Paenibacillus sp. S150]MBW4082863.1 CPBP family intramembrane metalloprotease [Paenibacillus sp. S150]
MKKFKFGEIKIKKADPQQLTDKLLLLNLYITQGLTLIIGLIWILLQKRNPIHILNFPENAQFVYWGLGLAVIMLAVDFLLTHIVPADSMDDGGINELLFGKRPLWHILVIAALVSVCEELLFRGAVQHSFGLYWTSILFAVIHVRYLRHWIPTGWVFLSSYGLGYIYIHSGTLWAPILCHFFIDVFSGIVIRYRRET